MIELSSTWWRLATRVDGGTVLSGPALFDEGARGDQADAIYEALAAASYGQEPIVLALDSMLCLSAQLARDESRRRRDRQAMLYQLEEWIPWAAEDVVADFVDSDNSTLAVAVAIEPLRHLLQALAAKGVSIVSIAPTAILAATELLNCNSFSGETLVVWQSNDSLEILRLNDQQITDWKWVAADAPSLRQELVGQFLRSNRPISLQIYNLDDQALAATSQIGFARSGSDDAVSLDRAEAAFEFAARMLGGSAESPIELRQSALGSRDRRFAVRGHVRALQFSAAALAIAVVLALVIRAHRYNVQAADLAADEIHVYQELFPNRQIPAGIRSRLESELSQLKGVRGETKDVPKTAPVLPVLRPLLAALPPDVRFRILELRIEDGQIYLDGEAREHGDAVAIAGLLRKNGFDVAAPRSQRLEGKKVSFRITGHFVDPNSPVPRGPAT
jgi:type II secretory pathway component PulL